MEEQGSHSWRFPPRRLSQQAAPVLALVVAVRVYIISISICTCNPQKEVKLSFASFKVEDPSSQDPCFGTDRADRGHGPAEGTGAKGRDSQHGPDMVAVAAALGLLHRCDGLLLEDLQVCHQRRGRLHFAPWQRARCFGV